ncbi:hypothetical protein Dimus_015467 [Dionaea muscipula]
MWGWRLFEGYSSNMLKLVDQLNRAKLGIQQHPGYHFHWFVQLYIINGLVLGWWASIINRSFLFVFARWCGSFQSMIRVTGFVHAICVLCESLDLFHFLLFHFL